MNGLRLAIIGCGACTKYIHLNQVRRARGLDLTFLVDPCIERAAELARRHPGVRVAADHREVIGGVDAALIAAPPDVHAPIAVDLLERGVHVLVEKPMATTVRDCDRMIEAAREGGALLAVGLNRRFFDSTRLTREILEAGLLGEIERFAVREGFIFDWDVASDGLFRRESGGVLMDTGAHVLDQLLFWLGDWDEVVSYRDDAFGGAEADCELRLRMQSGAAGMVEMSRTRDLPDRCVITGEDAELDVGTTWFDRSVRLRTRAGSVVLEGKPRGEGPDETSPKHVHRRELEEFADAVRAGRETSVPGAEGRRAIELIERCYAAREPLEHPWVFTSGVESCCPDPVPAWA